MAKLKQSIFGLSASGSISGALTYLRRMRQQIVEKKPELKDRKTAAQLSWRHMFLKVVALWHALSAAEKAEWESAARPKHMTGYAWFVSQALRPNPGIYLPLQGGKMAGEIDMDGYRIEDLPDPILAQDPDTLAARLAAIIAHAAIAAAHHARYADAEAAAVAAALIATHAALTTGIHGAGDSILATTLNIATHAAIAAVHHARYADAEAAAVAAALIATHAGLPNVHHIPPAAGAAVTVIAPPGTQVFSGTSPTTPTDLNLSGVVGANVAVVILKIYNPWSGTLQYGFRAKGETELTHKDSRVSHSNARLPATTFGMVIVHTNASGIVQWQCELAKATTTVDVVAYIK